MVWFAVIVENDKSQWSDKTGELYHFPNRYRQLLLPGTAVVYYKGKMRDRSFESSRLSPDPHYFGIATIGDHFQDTESPRNDWYARIIDFRQFSLPVQIKQPDGSYYEPIPDNRLSNYWRDGVRSIDQDTYETLLRAAAIPQPLASNTNDADQALTSSVEGQKKTVFTTTYERDPRLRDEAIRIHGTTCAACKFNFEATYGEHGKGYIHIHHRNPISDAGGPITVSARDDLIPLCANCHSIVHRRKDSTLSLDQLISILRQNS